jgi:molecular chaperone IbpA
MYKFDHTFSDLSKFDKYFVGADQMFKKFNDMAAQTAEVVSKYPPYNIKKIDDNTYVVEMAIAGFGKQDIELTLEDNKLVIKGNTETTESAENYLYRGISDRAFTRQFTLADNIEIKNADLFNGMLKIWLEAIIPESKKPKKIHVNDINSYPESTKEFLSEGKRK